MRDLHLKATEKRTRERVVFALGRYADCLVLGLRVKEHDRCEIAVEVGDMVARWKRCRFDLSAHESAMGIELGGDVH